MIHIKEFVNKVSLMDSKSKKDLILSSLEARSLRDEIMKLMADKIQGEINSKTEIQKIEISGGKW